MRTLAKRFLPIFLFSLIPTLLIWLPFFLRLKTFWTIPLPQSGMATIVANYDGPLFLVVAKTLYNQTLISQSFSFPLPTQYYAAHFPLFPILIKLVAIVTGYPYGMLFITLVSSFLALYFFNKLAKLYVDSGQALFLTFVFSIFPARWLIVRSVGSAEPLFIAAIIASVYYFVRKRYLAAGIWGLVAQLTKSPGILLFVAYVCAIIYPHWKSLATTSFPKWVKSMQLEKVFPIFLIPISLLGVFLLFKGTYGDFWAYFHSGDNIHLVFPPFQIFNYGQPWVGTFWLEEIIFVYLFGAWGISKLIKKGENILAWVAGIFFVSILFVSHRDLIRYSLPVVPFLFIAFSDTLLKKEFKIIIIFLIIPIYLFSLAFISQNIMPISDWGPFL